MWAIFVGPGGAPTAGTYRSRRERSGGDATRVDQSRLRLRHPYPRLGRPKALISDSGRMVVESKSRLRTNPPGPSITLSTARRLASPGVMAGGGPGASRGRAWREGWGAIPIWGVWWGSTTGV